LAFNSYAFIFLFLPVTWCVHTILKRWNLGRASKVWLLCASLAFYGLWNFWYIPLLLCSIIVNYTVGLLLAGPYRTVSPDETPPARRRRSILLGGLVFNIALLAGFKYTNFVITNVNWFAHMQLPLLRILWPLGISFYTFTQIAYLVDIYREPRQADNFVDYSLFVAFFPYLLSGPIVRHGEIVPQHNKTVGPEAAGRNLAEGSFLFLLGLFKKVVIADTFGLWADSGFEGTQELSFVEAWVTSLSFTFQIYFDFSGYIDMALGVARMFNVRLPLNFNSPYKALTIQDFWRRWHMTLSRFLRDYVYIPLGGNRGRPLVVSANLLITFLIGGLWHGAAWTFVFWGFLHGSAMVVQRFWGTLRIKTNPVVAWVLTFSFVNMAWVFFRARTWGDAAKVLKGMMGMTGFRPADLWSLKLISRYSTGMEFGLYAKAVKVGLQSTLVIACALAITLLAANSNQLVERFKPSLRYAILSSLFAIASLSVLWTSKTVSEFIYFAF
jgi:alginate O-acetyltransferase complex protein AlgI